MEPKEAPKLYEHPANQLIAQVQADHIPALDKSIGRIEKGVLASAREIPLYEKLLRLPGIGRILGMTITMEVGDIQRFKTDGDFASSAGQAKSGPLLSVRKMVWLSLGH
jgi:transposase